MSEGGKGEKEKRRGDLKSKFLSWIKLSLFPDGNKRSERKRDREKES